MTYEKKAMTAFAQAALAASDIIQQRFAETKLSGSVTRVVKVEAPNVESTGGGKQARESIVLRPETGEAGSLTCGFLDIGLRSCELRSYASLSALHRERFQTALDLPQKEYDAFLGELKKMLEDEGFVIKIVEPADRAAKAAGNAPAASGGGNSAVMIGIGVVAALVVVGVVAMLVLR